MACEGKSAIVIKSVKKTALELTNLAVLCESKALIELWEAKIIAHSQTQTPCWTISRNYLRT